MAREMVADFVSHHAHGSPLGVRFRGDFIKEGLVVKEQPVVASFDDGGGVGNISGANLEVLGQASVLHDAAYEVFSAFVGSKTVHLVPESGAVVAAYPETVYVEFLLRGMGHGKEQSKQ